MNSSASFSSVLHETPGLAPLLALIAAAITAGFSIQISYGLYSPSALAWLTFSLALSATAAVARWPRPTVAGEVLLRYALLAAIAVELGFLLFAWPPAGDLQKAGPTTRRAFYALMIGSATAIACVAADVKFMRRAWFPALIAMAFALCVLVIRKAPPPNIDVWVFQEDAARALLHGRDPYALTFPNLYGATSPYAEGLATNTRVLFGFPYPPVSLILSTLGFAIAGDHRYAQAAALCAAAALMGYARGGRNGKLAAGLLLLAPRLLHIIDQAWTEPLVILLLAATVFLACRKSRSLPVALGLFLASKQYLFILTPLAFMLLPQPWRWRDLIQLLAVALVTASVVTLPFGLFHWPAFVKALVTAHRLTPPHLNGLGLPALWMPPDEKEPSSALSFIAAGIALLLSIRRSPRTPAGFCAASAFVLFAFFACSRQGAPNYYFLVIAILCMSLAACDLSELPGGRSRGAMMSEGLPPFDSRQSRAGSDNNWNGAAGGARSADAAYPPPFFGRYARRATVTPWNEDMPMRSGRHTNFASAAPALGCCAAIFMLISLTGCASDAPHVAPAPVASAHPSHRPPPAFQEGPGGDPEDGPPQVVNVFGEVNGGVPRSGAVSSEAAFQQHTFADEGYDSDVTIDPTGKWMVFSSTRNNEHPSIYLQRVDGTAVTQITDGGSDDAYPSFSPDGKQIAFSSTRAGNWQIFIMDSDGRNIVQVTSGPMQSIHPSFSPDGNRLAYCALGVRSGQWELWIADLKTNEKRMIGYGVFPCWSPDKSGDKIAFQRTRQRGSRWFSLWTVDLIDGEGRRATEVAASSNAAILSPTWSPDGKHLAFATIIQPGKGGDSRPRGQTDIWTIDLDGANRQRLTDGHGNNLMPFWASDNRVYFVSDRGGVESIWSVRDEQRRPAMADIAEPKKDTSAVGATDAQEAVPK